MMNFKLFIVATCLAFAFASDYVVMNRREGVPANSGWSIVRRADPQHKVKFTLALQQQNLDKLDQFFWAVSDPKNPMYGKYMTRPQMRELTEASKQDQKSVLRWILQTENELPQGNLIDINNQGHSIEVTATALFAEKLFKTEMHLFHNSRVNIVMAKHMGTLSMPSKFIGKILLITGITELPPYTDKEVKEAMQRSQNNKRQTGDNQCNNPYTIKNLYGIPQDLYITNLASNASIYAEPSAGAIEGFGLASIEDYQTALGIPKNPITCIAGNGAQYYNKSIDDDLEANLDTEMLTGIAPNVQACFYIMESGNGWMYEFSNFVLGYKNAPWVISMSYGWNEDQACNNITFGYDFLGNCTAEHIPNSQVYINLTNINFQKLGALGHTLLAASGDGGTAGTHGSLNNCETMGPIFPASSPFVLTVGGTSIEQSTGSSLSSSIDAAGPPPICTNTFYQCDCSTSTNEQPALANDTAGFDTGGGFSVWSPQPAYQKVAVQAYLKSGVLLPPKQYFNGNNRGFPDVAGVSENVCLLDPGNSCQDDMVGGTSASTPLWAGIITLLNQDRLNAKKSLLGFFNPVIYDMFYAGSTKYFNNGFEHGNNPGGCPSNMGYNSKAGYWTPLTGCGSPQFANIRTYVASLP